MDDLLEVLFNWGIIVIVAIGAIFSGDVEGIFVGTAIIIAVIYFKILRPRKIQQEEERRRQEENEKWQREYDEVKQKFRADIEKSQFLQSCRQVIDAFLQFIEHNNFEISGGNIYIIIPERMGEISAVLDNTSDEWKIRNLLNGEADLSYLSREHCVAALESGRDIKERILPGTADMDMCLVDNGVPQILLDTHDLDVCLNDKGYARWTARVYGIEVYTTLYIGRLSHYERLEIVSDILKRLYPNTLLVVSPRLYR